MRLSSARIERSPRRVSKLRGSPLGASSRRLRATAVVLVSLAVAAGISGCNPFSQASATSGQPVVRVGVVPGIDNATLYLAKKRGYFSTAGIDVRIVDFSSVRLELRALSVGQVDVAAGDYGNLFAARAALQKTAYKILADGYDAAPGVVEIMTMPNSPVKTPADLANQVIGAPDTDLAPAPASAPNSLVIASATSVLRSYQVNISGVTWSDMSQRQEISELVHGQVHAALLTEPYIYQAQLAGAVELLDACSGATAGIPLSGYFTSTSWPRDKAKEVAAFRAGLTQAAAQASMPGPVQAVLPGYAKLSKQAAALITTGVYPLSTVTGNLQRTADLLWFTGMISRQLDVAPMIVH
jgi:NitT/TauT family transport system substrate-binding protein